MTIDPCRICGQPVQMGQGASSRRLRQATARPSEVRRCTSVTCASNTGQRKLGERI